MRIVDFVNRLWSTQELDSMNAVDECVHEYRFNLDLVSLTYFKCIHCSRVRTAPKGVSELTVDMSRRNNEYDSRNT